MCFRAKIFISEINISNLKHIGHGRQVRRSPANRPHTRNLDRRESKNVGGAGDDRDMSRSQAAGDGAGINLALGSRFFAGAFPSGATIMPTCDE